MDVLKDTDGNARAQAAWALGLKGDYRAVEALSAATKDENKHVRKQATWALGMILMRDRRAASMNITIEADPNIENDESQNRDRNRQRQSVRNKTKDKDND